MHVPDGILPLPVMLGGYAAAAGVTAFCLHRIGRREDPRRQVPKAAMLTAVFFAASLIHIPLPPMSVHLILTGLLGVLLGWFAFPAILVGLFLQAVMFGHGGLTTLGVNALVQGVPALMAFGLFSMRAGSGGPAGWGQLALAFFAGAGAVALSVLLFSGLVLTNLPAHLDAQTERFALGLFALAHMPLAVIEGVVVVVALHVLRRASPGLLSHG